MKVRDVMKREVITVTPKTTYDVAARMLTDHTISGLPVVDDQGTLVGMVSEKDLFRALFPRYEEYVAEFDTHHNQEEDEARIETLRTTPVENYMHRKIFTIAPDAPILRAGGLMLAHGIHRLPVVENGRCVGIVTREDIYRAIFLHHLER